MIRPSQCNPLALAADDLEFTRMLFRCSLSLSAPCHALLFCIRIALQHRRPTSEICAIASLTPYRCRLLSATIHDNLLDPAILPPLVRNVRLAAFPDNAFPPARVPPTGEQIAEIKRECAKAIIGSIPNMIRRYYFATTEETAVVKDVERMLDIVGDAYINKHLIVAAIELVVVRLFPELTVVENT